MRLHCQHGANLRPQAGAFCLWLCALGRMASLPLQAAAHGVAGARMFHGRETQTSLPAAGCRYRAGRLAATTCSAAKAPSAPGAQRVADLVRLGAALLRRMQQ
jgi:hypothetical protein